MCVSGQTRYIPLAGRVAKPLRQHSRHARLGYESSYDALLSETDLHCQIRYVERGTPCISMAENLHHALQPLPREHVPT
jgi:hypothetical protein